MRRRPIASWGGLLVLLMATLAPPGAAAGGRLVTLGTDPANDAPPSLDLTYLKAGRAGRYLVVVIGVAGILPEVEGADPAGIEWTFDVRKRTFVAEAYSSAGEPGFVLFEVKGETLTEVAELHGTYSSDDGFILMHVPLKAIGARRGTKISGHGPKGTADVDAHVHLGVTDHQPDAFATTRDFIVP